MKKSQIVHVDVSPLAPFLIEAPTIGEAALKLIIFGFSTWALVGEVRQQASPSTGLVATYHFLDAASRHEIGRVSTPFRSKAEIARQIRQAQDMVRTWFRFADYCL